MKKAILLSIGIGMSFGVLAQSAAKRHFHGSAASVSETSIARASHYRTSALGSSDTLSDIASPDTAQLYYAGNTADSGFISGMDAYGDMGFAQRFDFSGADSSLKVTGVIAIFGGTVSPSSTKKVKFYTWSEGAQTLLTGARYYSGLPDVALDSVSVDYTALGITPGMWGVSINMFTTPTPFLYNSFFVGCTLNYDAADFAGDTIGLATSQIGNRSSNEYYVVGPDTIIDNRSVTMFSDGLWYDNWYDNFQIPYDFYLFPIVTVGVGTLSTEGVTKKELTFYGNYPSPAVNSTNIKFALKSNSDVTITVNDMSGRTIKTINEKGLSAGEHIINVNTADLASGEYIYLVRTSSGAGMASKLSVIK